MGIAEAIDRQEGCDGYANSVRLMQSLNANPDDTPSARMLDKLQSENCSFFELALMLAKGHRDYFAAITPLSEERQAQYAQEVRDSVIMQREIEASDEISLDQYLAEYYSSGS